MPAGSRSATQTSSSSSDSSPARKPNKRGDMLEVDVQRSPQSKPDGSSNETKSREVPSFDSSDSNLSKGSNPEDAAAYCPCSCHTKSRREVRTLYHFDGSDNSGGYSIQAANLIVIVWVAVVAWFVYCHIMTSDKLYDPIIEFQKSKSVSW